MTPTDPTLIAAALETLRQADAARADALAAITLPCLMSALRYARTDRDREKIARFAAYLPVDDPPESCGPHDVYSSGALRYHLPADGWAARLLTLRARFAPVPLVIVKDGSTSIRPAAGAPEGGEPIADWTITAEATADYPVRLLVTWWTEIGPGVVVRIDATTEGRDVHAWHPMTQRVRYHLDNAPKSDRVRQHPEDRKWSASWTWGASPRVIRWWTSPGDRPRLTWTWHPGAELADAIGGAE